MLIRAIDAKGAALDGATCVVLTDKERKELVTPARMPTPERDGWIRVSCRNAAGATGFVVLTAAPRSSLQGSAGVNVVASDRARDLSTFPATVTVTLRPAVDGSAAAPVAAGVPTPAPNVAAPAASAVAAPQPAQAAVVAPVAALAPPPAPAPPTSPPSAVVPAPAPVVAPRSYACGRSGPARRRCCGASACTCRPSTEPCRARVRTKSCSNGAVTDVGAGLCAFVSAQTVSQTSAGPGSGPAACAGDGSRHGCSEARRNRPRQQPDQQRPRTAADVGGAATPAILNAVESWRSAWEKRDIAAYLGAMPTHSGRPAARHATPGGARTAPYRRPSRQPQRHVQRHQGRDQRRRCHSDISPDFPGPTATVMPATRPCA